MKDQTSHLTVKLVEIIYLQTCKFRIIISQILGQVLLLLTLWELIDKPGRPKKAERNKDVVIGWSEQTPNKM